jgi:hypothetical protein
LTSDFPEGLPDTPRIERERTLMSHSGRALWRLFGAAAVVLFVALVAGTAVAGRSSSEKWKAPMLVVKGPHNTVRVPPSASCVLPQDDRKAIQDCIKAGWNAGVFTGREPVVYAKPGESVSVRSWPRMAGKSFLATSAPGKLLFSWPWATKPEKAITFRVNKLLRGPLGGLIVMQHFCREKAHRWSGGIEYICFTEDAQLYGIYRIGVRWPGTG